MNEIIRAMHERRSIRSYTDEPVSEDHITTILEAGRWAPSGKNNQPWRFKVTGDTEIKAQLAELTKYTRIVNESKICISIFFHKPSGYHREKDYMSIGACIQNMLLAAHSLGLGAVWLGEILANEAKVREILSVNHDHELAAVIALGHSTEEPKSNRQPMDALLI